MSHIPSEVIKRLEQLEQCDLSIQNPNFTVDDLTYHEPDRVPGFPGAIEGSWSDDGEIFEFGLVGQISAHDTHIGDYGDLFSRNPGVTSFAVGDLVKAKWKLSVAMPYDEAPSGPQAIQRRQFESLDKIERANFAENSGAGKGVLKTQGFVSRSDAFWRACAFSENIFCQHPESGNFEAYDAFDKSGIVASLPYDKRASIKVRPVEFFDTDAQPVPNDRVETLFRPGSWVELSCKLRVWISPEREQGRQRRSASRSYQLIFDAVQYLAEGRLREGPVKTLPRAPAKKRRFQPVVVAAGPSKRVCFGEVPAQ